MTFSNDIMKAEKVNNELEKWKHYLRVVDRKLKIIRQNLLDMNFKTEKNTIIKSITVI